MRCNRLDKWWLVPALLLASAAGASAQDLCSQYGSPIFVGSSFEGPRAIVPPGGTFGPNEVAVVSYTVPQDFVSTASATGYFAIGPWSSGRAGGTLSFSTVPCDFRAADPSGLNGPLLINYSYSLSATELIRYTVTGGTSPYMKLQAGQTYYFNFLNRSGNDATCGLGCNLFVENHPPARDTSPPPRQANYTVSGTVTSYGTGTPVAGVAIIASGQSAACATTDAAGAYSCTLPNAFTGTVSATLAGATFSPQTYAITDLSANLTDNFAQCGSRVSASSHAFLSSGGSWTLTVNAPAGCAWAQSGTIAAGLTMSPTQGTGATQVSFTAAPNTDIVARNWNVVIGQEIVAVSEEPRSRCQATLAPSSITLPAEGGSQTVGVSFIDTGCSWNISGAPSWLTIEPNTVFTGDKQLTLRADANGSGARTANLSLGSASISVFQPTTVAACTYGVSPTSASIGNGGSTQSFTVTTGSNCSWTATTQAAWILVSSGSGTGSGGFSATVAANSTASPRSSNIVVADQSVGITQDAGSGAPATPSTCTTSVDKTTIAIGAQAVFTLNCASSAGIYRWVDGTGTVISSTVGNSMTYTGTKAGAVTIHGEALQQFGAATLVGSAVTLTVSSSGTAPPSTAGLKTVTVVEYRYALKNHYFLTGYPDEIAALDKGTIGWARTGKQFYLWDQANVDTTGMGPACRYFNSPPTTHFFSIEKADCDLLESLNPTRDINKGWLFETARAFIGMRVESKDKCPAGFNPIVRFYNDRYVQNDSNHRYAGDQATIDEMTAAKWINEGVVMCQRPTP